MEDKKFKKQQAVYETLKKAIESLGFKYQANDEKLYLQCSVVGNDLEIPSSIGINTSYSIICLASPIPFTFKEDKFAEIIQALAIANGLIPAGCFYLDFNTKRVVFRASLLFDESIISEKTICDLFGLSLNIIDVYNDKFMALNNGIIDLEGFMKAIK